MRQRTFPATTLLVCFSVWQAIGSLHAEEPSQSALIALGATDERWADTQQISGNFIQGVRVALDETPAAGFGTAWVPASLAGTELCLEIQGDSRLYQGLQNLEVQENWAGGAASLPINTEFQAAPRDLRSLNANEALVRLLPGSCSDIRNELILLPTAWRQDFYERPESIEILLQIPVVEHISLIAIGRNWECQLIETVAAGFNRICPLTSLEGDQLEVEIRREILDTTPSGQISPRRLPSLFTSIRLN